MTMNRRKFLGTMAGSAAGFTILGCSSGGHSNKSVSGLPAAQQRRAMQEWFQDAKFGMFIHWGVYSVLGRGEWVMHNEEMTVDEYEQLPSQFNPTGYDPAEWVGLAKEAGMEYMTITSKHHDGFAMWDSEASDYDIVDRTPYGKDVLKMLADECQRQGVKLFFYHSHLDWHHPDYYPRGRTGQHSNRPDEGDFDSYLEYMNTQIHELADGRYGQLGGFWFDGWWDQRIREEDVPDKACHVNWQLQETYDLIQQLQPQALIGNNHHVAPFPGEGFQMFEKDLPGQNTTGFSGDAVIGRLPLETCDTINRSWGYNKNDTNFKSTPELIGYLVRAAGHNANFLLNVGPTPRGTIQPEFVDRLRDIGAWMSTYAQTIKGTRGGPMPPQDWGVTTQKEWKIFVHILDPDSPEQLPIFNTSDIILDGAHLYGSDTPVNIARDADLNVVINLQHVQRNPVDTIVVLELTS